MPQRKCYRHTYLKILYPIVGEVQVLKAFEALEGLVGELGDVIAAEVDLDEDLELGEGGLVNLLDLAVPERERE